MPPATLASLQGVSVILARRRSSLLLVDHAGSPLVLKLTQVGDDEGCDATCVPQSPAASELGAAAAGLERLLISGSSESTRALREINLLGSLGSGSIPFVARSHGWLLLPRVACLLLEFVSGGSLAALLERGGPCSARSARFYLGCCALALDGLHGAGLAHRDVKLENICIDGAGYALLVDLGFARHVGDGRASTLLGTPEMLAPEVFLGEGHGVAVDLWALGVVLYELLLDAVPFSGETPTEVYQSALAGRPVFPSSEWIFPAAAQQLVTRLLAREADARPTPTQVLAHPYFEAHAFPGGADGLDVAGLRRRELAPPFVPRLKTPFDTRYFASAAADDADKDSAEEEELWEVRDPCSICVDAAAAEVPFHLPDELASWPTTERLLCADMRFASCTQLPPPRLDSSS
mmetsp:Transcript_45919/g.97954  ORF Transcript_45919/g.97954 Transcript_45919/m.97954 type:complete len:407 (-) Transcript_45919:140-1360(-)